jgi:hypothetical protein
MKQMQEEHAKLPINQFDARLAEELEDRVEFLKLTVSVGFSWSK